MPLVTDRKPHDTGVYEMQGITFQPFMKAVGVS